MRAAGKEDGGGERRAHEEERHADRRAREGQRLPERNREQTVRTCDEHKDAGEGRTLEELQRRGVVSAVAGVGLGVATPRASLEISGSACSSDFLPNLLSLVLRMVLVLHRVCRAVVGVLCIIIKRLSYLSSH